MLIIDFLSLALQMMNTRIGLILTYFVATLFILTSKPNGVLGEVGVARSYGPPYLPTKCRGDRLGGFPSGNLLAAAGDGLWDNGAACGRRYRVRCVSGPNRPCKAGTSVEIKIVDACKTSPCPAAMVLSNEAFDAIARLSAGQINIEYMEL